MKKPKLDGTNGNGYQPIGSYGRLHDVLQNSFGTIEESGRVMRKYSLHFPLYNDWILDELRSAKKRIDRLIDLFEKIESENNEGVGPE